MIRVIAFGFAAAMLVSAGIGAKAQGLEDETRDRVLLVHQSRGTLAPGTRPKCFPARVDETVASSQFQCPWDAPNGRRPYPTARSFWGVFGNY